MNKKKWALVVLCGLIIFGYIKLFYKTYNENVVAKSADSIVAIDVKRITNTIIWQYITTPNLWKISSSNNVETDIVSWKDMVEIPDYVLAFHASRQPANAWYSVLKIRDDAVFTKGIQQQHFEKIDSNVYVSKEVGIQFYKNGNSILVTTASEESNDLTKIATELFLQKNYISKIDLAKVINAKSHVALKLHVDNFLQEDGIITANFDANKITIEGNVIPKKEFSFTENNFSHNGISLLTLSFTQPPTNVFALLNDSAKANISRAINVNIDSLMLPSNKWYNLDVAGILPRTDSAITYTYDDDFNKVEKVVVNNIEEPAFNFTIYGDSVSEIYNNWIFSTKLEKTNAGFLFTPMPFVKSYCRVIGKNTLEVTANNYVAKTTDKNTNCIFFINVMLSKIPASLLKYAPTDVAKAIENFETIEIVAKKNEGKIFMQASIRKKKTDKPIWEF
jgi:hypothetical protein